MYVKAFYIQIWFKFETPLSFFLTRTMAYRKNLLKQFSCADYVKIIELYVLHTWRHMQSK